MESGTPLNINLSSPNTYKRSVMTSSRAEDQFSFEAFDWNQLAVDKSLGVGALELGDLQLVLPNDYMIPLQNKHNQDEAQLRLEFMPEFLTPNKRKSGFGATFFNGGVGLMARGGQAIEQVGMTGVGAITGGIAAVGHGAVKGAGAVGQ
ncbi:hypothetical protein BGZ51_009682, partial [Haplosporangium sp. Z 767]